MKKPRDWVNLAAMFVLVAVVSLNVKVWRDQSVQFESAWLAFSALALVVGLYVERRKSQN